MNSVFLQNFYVFACFTSLILLVVYHWRRRKLYLLSWKCNGPFAWPIIGNIFDFGTSLEDMTVKMYEFFKNNPPIQRLWVFQKLCIGISTPENLSVVLNNPKCLQKADFFYDAFKPVVGIGLFTAPVEIWKLHRKIINPTLNQKLLNTFMIIFNERADVFTELLKKRVAKDEFDIFDPMCLCTLDIICESIMGIKIEAQIRRSSYLTCIQRCMAIAMIRTFSIFRHKFLFFKTPVGREVLLKIKIINEFVYEVIEQKKDILRKEKLESNFETPFCGDVVPRRKAFLEFLLEENKFTDEELVYQVHTFITGGSDTSGTVMSFVCIMLGMHPEIQEKVFDEIVEIIGHSDREVTCEDLPKLEYMERVIKETLRITPITVAIGRECVEEIQLGSITVPPGVVLLIDILNLHRNPEYWIDPLKFDPDRFLPEEMSKRHPYCYIPFSSGQRNCIGLRFAMMSMKVVLTKLLLNYKLRTSYKSVEDVKLEWHLIMKAVDGCKITLESRINKEKQKKY